MLRTKVIPGYNFWPSHADLKNFQERSPSVLSSSRMLVDRWGTALLMPVNLTLQPRGQAEVPISAQNGRPYVHADKQNAAPAPQGLLLNLEQHPAA